MVIIGVDAKSMLQYEDLEPGDLFVIQAYYDPAEPFICMVLEGGRAIEISPDPDGSSFAGYDEKTVVHPAYLLDPDRFGVEQRY